MSTPPPDAAGPGVGDDTLVEALAAAVAGHRVRRVPLPVLRAAFARHDPTGATSADARTRLAAALAHLERAHVLALPKTSRLYEAHLQPPLPHWVERPAAARQVRPSPPQRVWRPELAAAAAAARTAEDFDVLEAVDRFLREDGAIRPLVPHRERSVELFGNEKRLDTLVRTKLFTTGALSLDLLRCYQPPLPLTALHTGDPGPEPQLLIVENHATYASVLRLARARSAAGAPALAVGWGSGNQLPQAIGGVALLDPVPAALWYFGDLDEEGLRIAADAADAAVAAGLPPLRPALPLYAQMLRHGARQKGHRPLDATTARQLTSWLSDPILAAEAADVLVAGCRIAQESVGYETLYQLLCWTAR